MTAIPASHISDAHKLNADGRVELFELTPIGAYGTVYFKSDNSVTWQGHEYLGVPLTYSGEDRTAQGAAQQPRLIIGQENVNLSMFKPIVNDGALDGSIIHKLEILLDDLINNRPIYLRRPFRVRRVEGYTRSQISLQLASFSDSLSFTMPFRQYFPPAFPAVNIG